MYKKIRKIRNRTLVKPTINEYQNNLSTIGVRNSNNNIKSSNDKHFRIHSASSGQITDN